MSDFLDILDVPYLLFEMRLLGQQVYFFDDLRYFDPSMNFYSWEGSQIHISVISSIHDDYLIPLSWLRNGVELQFTGGSVYVIIFFN